MGTQRKWKDHDECCTRCGTNVERMSRVEQDIHEEECLKQKKLL